MSWLAPLRTMARSTPASFALSRRALSRSLRFTQLAYQARRRSSSALGTIDSGGPIAAKTDQCSEKTRITELDARDQVLPAPRDLCSELSTSRVVSRRPCHSSNAPPTTSIVSLRPSGFNASATSVRYGRISSSLSGTPLVMDPPCADRATGFRSSSRSHVHAIARGSRRSHLPASAGCLNRAIHP